MFVMVFPQCQSEMRPTVTGMWHFDWSTDDKDPLRQKRSYWSQHRAAPRRISSDPELNRELVELLKSGAPRTRRPKIRVNQTERLYSDSIKTRKARLN